MVNRKVKIAKDVADWLPEHNACWYVAQTLEVRRKYGLSIDRREARAAHALLLSCESIGMVFPEEKVRCAER